MISIGKLERNIDGALLLALLQPRGLSLFDSTDRAFLQSFLAAVLALPAYKILWDFVGPLVDPEMAPRFLPMVIYGFGWLWVPVFSFFLLQILGKKDRYRLTVIAINWCALVSFTGFSLCLLVANGLPDAWTRLFTVLAMITVYVYQWYILRCILGAGVLAILFLMIDVIGTEMFMNILRSASKIS